MTPPLGAVSPVLVLVDHVAMKVRLRDAIAPHAPLRFVASEHELAEHFSRPVRLIFVHGVPPFADASQVSRTG